MLGGPVEFTPGIFDMDSGSGGVETTRAKQLAMYPNYFSGLQMVAGLPSSYLADRPSTVSVGEVAQAEFGDNDGFNAASSWANAQGERYLEVDPNSVSTGSTVTWTVEDAAAGEYDLHLRYASDEENNAVPADEPRTATVTVDGSAVAQITLPPTDYWDVWNSVSATVTLEADTETVGVLLADDDTGGFNLDSVALTAPGEPMPDPETAPIRGPTIDAFKFIEDVPAGGWEDTRVLDSAIGEYVVTARQKDDAWYLGAMTDEGGRALDIDLEFLSPPVQAGAETQERQQTEVRRRDLLGRDRRELRREPRTGPHRRGDRNPEHDAVGLDGRERRHCSPTPTGARARDSRAAGVPAARAGRRGDDRQRDVHPRAVHHGNGVERRRLYRWNHGRVGRRW